MKCDNLVLITEFLDFVYSIVETGVFQSSGENERDLRSLLVLKGYLSLCTTYNLISLPPFLQGRKVDYKMNFSTSHGLECQA